MMSASRSRTTVQPKWIIVANASNAYFFTLGLASFLRAISLTDTPSIRNFYSSTSLLILYLTLFASVSLTSSLPFVNPLVIESTSSTGYVWNNLPIDSATIVLIDSSGCWVWSNKRLVRLVIYASKHLES